MRELRSHKISNTGHRQLYNYLAFYCAYPLIVRTVPAQSREKWNTPHGSNRVFEGQETVNRRVLARFSDVCEKQFSALGANRDRIQRYVEESMA